MFNSGWTSSGPVREVISDSQRVQREVEDLLNQISPLPEFLNGREKGNQGKRFGHKWSQKTHT